MEKDDTTRNRRKGINYNLQKKNKRIMKMREEKKRKKKEYAEHKMKKQTYRYE